MGGAVVFRRFGLVLFHTVAVLIALPGQIERPGVPLLRRLLVQRGGFLMVLLYPRAPVIADAKRTGPLVATLLMGGLVQLDCLFDVLLHAVAVFKAHANQYLRSWVSLLGGLGKPHGGFLVVLLHADAVEVEESQIALSGGEALLRRFPVQFCRPLLVHFHPVSQLIAQSQLALGRRIALFRRQSEQLDRLVVILFRSLAPRVAQAQVELCADVVAVCGFGEPIERLFLILWCAVLAVGVAQGQPVFRIQVPVLRCGLHLPEALPLSCGYVGDALHQLRVEIYHGSILLILVWLQVFVLMIYHVLRFLSFSVAAAFSCGRSQEIDLTVIITQP